MPVERYSMAYRLERDTAPCPVTNCLLWTKYTGAYGYGHTCKLVDGKWKNVKAHRAAYEERFGPVPDGLCVCHKCDTPAGCNPEHLFLGTHAENMQDMKQKKRAVGHAGQSHPRTKLKDSDIPTIRELIKTESCVAVAERYGVKKHVIHDISRGRHWSHIK